MTDWKRKTGDSNYLWEGVSQDTRFAFRTLLRNPLFTLAALLSLAFGIGANTAVYTFVHGYLIDPLPFRESDRLASVMTAAPSRGRDRWQLSYPEVLELRENSRAFSELSAHGQVDVTLTGGDEPRRLFASRISYDLFYLLRSAPAQGEAHWPPLVAQNRRRVLAFLPYRFKTSAATTPGPSEAGPGAGGCRRCLLRAHRAGARCRSSRCRTPRHRKC